MKLRKIIFWMHFTVGLIVGSVVLVMSCNRCPAFLRTAAN